MHFYPQAVKYHQKITDTVEGREGWNGEEGWRGRKEEGGEVPGRARPVAGGVGVGVGVGGGGGVEGMARGCPSSSGSS